MARIEHRTLINTSQEEAFDYVIEPANRPEWIGSVLEVTDISDTLDRLLHHSHIIAISGPSYRIKDKLKKLKGKEVEEMPKV